MISKGDAEQTETSQGTSDGVSEDEVVRWLLDDGQSAAKRQRVNAGDVFEVVDRKPVVKMSGYAPAACST